MTRESSIRRLRSTIGALLLDLPRDFRAMSRGPRGYLAVRNRHDRLEAAPEGPGFRCDWTWTRDLHAAKVLPRLGRRLFARALADRRIELRDGAPPVDGSPRVSFVIGHRGRERENLLHATLASIAAQDVAVEAIVVEYSSEPEVGSRLPAWVRHVHVACEAGAPYNRSLAFNAGAAVARAPVLVLHDNDLLVSTDYASSALAHVARGFDVVNLKRFIFYLTREETTRVVAARVLRASAPEAVMQNALGGGSLVVDAEAYRRLGGMDEGFVGWGGEDNEFWDRCALARRWEYGYLPLVHLWHPSQPQKADPANPTLARYRELSAIDPQERVRRLHERRASRVAVSEAAE